MNARPDPISRLEILKLKLVKLIFASWVIFMIYGLIGFFIHPRESTSRQDLYYLKGELEHVIAESGNLGEWSKVEMYGSIYKSVHASLMPKANNEMTMQSLINTLQLHGWRKYPLNKFRNELTYCKGKYLSNIGPTGDGRGVGLSLTVKEYKSDQNCQ